MKKFKILIFTSSRAEYGIMANLIKKISIDKFFNLNLIVSGSHLEKSFGYTLSEIKNDKIKHIIELKSKYSNLGKKNFGKYYSDIFKNYYNFLSKSSANLVLLLGDRFETFAFATASMFNNTPIAHLHGGESAEGLHDEAMRHSISKMAQLHFVSTDIYKKRLSSMGENRNFIFNYGAPSLENLKDELIEKETLEKRLKIKIENNLVLASFHPETLNPNFINFFKKILSKLKMIKNKQIIFTYANQDFEGIKMNCLIEKFCKENANSYVWKSLGRENFLSLMKYSRVVIGNSSSGIIEAPEFKVPVINVGNRQRGRVTSNNNFETFYDLKKFKKIINNVLNCKIVVNKVKNPYFQKNTSSKIIKKIKNTNYNNIIIKKFYEN